MTYAGLTISDKPALMEAQKNGHTYIYLNHDGFRTVYNVNLALAQIAEMESAEKPLTWNERINQMTVEEKANWLLTDFPKFHKKAYDHAWKNRKTGRFGAYYRDRMAELLNSPYTEGEKT